MRRVRSVGVMFLTFILVYITGKIFIELENRPNDVKIFNLLRDVSVPEAIGLSANTHVSERFVHNVRCDELMKGSKSEIEKAKKIMQNKNYTRKAISDYDYIQLTQNCDKFKLDRKYNMHISEEEKQISVAYSILLYKDVEQAERLFRAIYSPNNLYCFHVDANSNQSIHEAVDGIAKCFDNVIVVSRKEYVVYSGFTRLQADLNCMSDLLRMEQKWDYFINLPSQQFPLKTNAEIAKILKIYNGANDIEGITGNRRLAHRFTFRHIYKEEPMKNTKLRPFKLNQKKEDPPFNITVVKGSAYGIFSRDFVNFVINSYQARTILDWFHDVLSPDEYYWATLNYNHQLEAPGSSFYKGVPDKKPWLAVFVAWGGADSCAGRFVRGICIFGVGDLHLLKEKPQLFSNKFYLDYQPLALDCMEEWHRNRSMAGLSSDFNSTFYKSLPFIKPSS
ncbi:Beta-1 [Mactra antiquata]